MNKLSSIFRCFAKPLLVANLVIAAPMAAAAVPAANDVLWSSLDAQIADASKNPNRYAVALGLSSSDLLAAGSWQRVGDRAEWRLPIALPGALNISADLAGLQLPGGGEVWLTGGGVAQGPYGVKNAARLTAMVPGEHAELTVLLPAAKRGDFSISSLTVFYGFRGLESYSGENTRADSEPQTRAGACLDNNDVLCPVGNDWQDEVRSVARLTISNLLLCSAILLNDTSQSLTPYLLTADHCGEGIGSDTGGFDAIDALNTIAYWNFDRAQCGPPDNGVLTQNQSGALLRAANRDIDFALIELQSPPLASFNVHWAGWDARGVGASSGAGIHHPSGDEKKVSLFNTSVRKERPLSSLDANDYWRVVWSNGVTERGSSGSGLWNEDKRVIGSLSRGLSECRTAENSNNGNPETFPDFYSAFDAAWLGDGTSGTQLSAWLDSSNTGVLAMNGRDASSAAAPVPDGSNSNPGGGDSGGGSSGGSGGSGGASGASASGGGGGMPFLLLPLLAAAGLRRQK